MDTYKIIRFCQACWQLNRSVMATGLTLEEAQAHCKDPETSSRTATSPAAVANTEQHGEWFDGYEKEDRCS